MRKLLMVLMLMLLATSGWAEPCEMLAKRMVRLHQGGVDVDGLHVGADATLTLVILDMNLLEYAVSHEDQMPPMLSWVGGSMTSLPSGTFGVYVCVEAWNSVHFDPSDLKVDGQSPELSAVVSSKSLCKWGDLPRGSRSVWLWALPKELKKDGTLMVQWQGQQAQLEVSAK